jgi:2-(1,2-epoxy-1,2-dihydrophenyl)acetyl-CoA isomerase
VKEVLVERRDGISTITLNRPDTYNALSISIAEEFANAIIDEGSADEVRVIIVTGAGKAFSGGGDIKGMSEYLKGDPLLFFKRLVMYLDAAILDITRLEKPVLCAVNGVAAGAGLSLALSCDMLFAAESASFDAAYHRVGLVPDGGVSFLIPHTVGYHRAIELVYSDRPLSAQEALQWGLINRVVPDDQLMPTVRAYAERLAKGPISAYGTAKRLFLEGLQNSLETQLEAERQAIAQRGRTADFREAVQRFMDKVRKNS